MPAPVLLDVDTGVDDALALVVAARHPRLELRGVICTAGNVEVARVVTNTRYVLAAAGRPDVPVVRGAATTSDGRAPRGPSRHGPDGLAGLGPRDPLPVGDGRSPAALVRDVVPGATLVLLAPQSSIGLALRDDPDVLRDAAGVLAAVGSRSGAPEFNGDHDPAARAAVAAAARRCGVPLVEVPVEVGRAARLEPARLATGSGDSSALAAALLTAWDGSLGDAAVLATLVEGDPAEVVLEALR